MNFFWNGVYKIYPPLLRVLEKIRIHNFRQDFLVGILKRDSNHLELRAFLVEEGFEEAILAWKDPGELLSMRKIDNEIFQYHVRIFSDGEVRCHYEYSSEGNPWGHIFEIRFEAQKEYFQELFSDYL